jgi:hypothetical protein
MMIFVASIVTFELRGWTRRMSKAEEKLQSNIKDAFRTYLHVPLEKEGKIRIRRRIWLLSVLIFVFFCSTRAQVESQRHI